MFISTHVCPDAPTAPHDPVPFMNSPVETWQVNKEEVTDALDGVLVVDTTKGNRIINHRGFAISPTVRQGYTVSYTHLDVYKRQGLGGLLECNGKYKDFGLRGGETAGRGCLLYTSYSSGRGTSV